MTARSRSSLACALAALSLLALVFLASPAAVAAAKDTSTPKGTFLIAPDVQKSLPPVTPERAIGAADRTPQVIGERRRHPDLRPDHLTLYKGSGNWGVSYRAGSKKLADVTVDGHTGKVIEAWQGVKADWVMARATKGYFGKLFESWYVWLPLCLLFVVPFIDPRRPLRMLHLDLLVLVGGFGLSHFFFNKGEIGTSVPLVYPVLGYLLLRMLIAGFRPRQRAARLTRFPAAYFVVAILVLVGVRIGLDFADGKVGDVGYGSAAGATRIEHGQPLYVDSGSRDQHLDTYGPVNYLAYYPFIKVFPLSATEASTPDDYKLPAARTATLLFDLLTVLGLFLLGGRLRPGKPGRMLGLALAYGWVSYPYTLFPLMSNTNDTLISMLLVFALLAVASPRARGGLLALASAAKFAPLALAPLFASGRGESRSRSWLAFSLMFALVAIALVVPFIPKQGGLGVFYGQTIGFQLGRYSPFSVWGQNPSLDWLLTIVKLATAALAVAVAFVPRRRSTVQVAALGAAVLIATQLIAIHWFYFYIDWFAPFVLAVLFFEYGSGQVHARRPDPATVEIAPLSEPQRELAGVGA